MLSNKCSKRLTQTTFSDTVCFSGGKKINFLAFKYVYGRSVLITYSWGAAECRLYIDPIA